MRTISIGFLAALLIAAAVPAVASAATRPITFNLDIGTDCIRGHASDGVPVKLALKNADGALKAKRTITARSDGSFEACGLAGIVEIGDLVRANDGVSIHELAVPDLTAFGSRDKDLYKGRGPAGAYLKIICAFSDGFEPCMATWKVRVNSEGKWSFSPGWDVGGDDRMVVQWKSPAGDKVFTVANTAYVIVRIGSPRVVGATRNGTVANFVLKRGSALDVKATANPMSSPFNGDFAGPFRNALGNKVNVREGDLITSDISSDIDWFVPEVSATADSATGHVTGHCPSDGGAAEVTVYRDGENVGGDSNLVPDEGNFDFDLAYGNVPYEAGDRILVRCELNGTTGDWVEKMFTAI